MNELIGFIAVAVLVALVLRAVLRYVVRRMREEAQKYRDAVIRDDIASVKGWLASQRKTPHG